MLASSSAGSARAATKTTGVVDGRRLMVACVRHQQMRRLAAAAAAGAAAANAAAADAPSPSSRAAAMPTAQELRAQLRGGGFACMAAVAAAGNTQAEIYFGLAKAIDIYLVVLTGRVLLSWFRNLDWSSEPLNSLSQLTDPFLNCFRGLVPAIAGIDLSPMLGFFGLQFIRGALVSMASA